MVQFANVTDEFLNIWVTNTVTGDFNYTNMVEAAVFKVYYDTLDWPPYPNYLIHFSMMYFDFLKICYCEKHRKVIMERFVYPWNCFKLQSIHNLILLDIFDPHFPNVVYWTYAHPTNYPNGTYCCVVSYCSFLSDSQNIFLDSSSYLLIWLWINLTDILLLCQLWCSPRVWRWFWTKSWTTLPPPMSTKPR